MARTLDQELEAIEPKLAAVLSAIANAVVRVADTLRTASVTETGSVNALGDKQLGADVAADDTIYAALRVSGAVETASSEERPQDHLMGGSGYAVAFDPLDGSSIVGANFAVGSIFAVFPGRHFLGRSGREQVAAAYAVHGPKTVLVIARPVSGCDTTKLVVQEFSYGPDGWVLTRPELQLEEDKRIFAPANLRAAAENKAYHELVLHWMSQKYTLRYSGGMVPDVHHILAKGGGVFCNPYSPSAPAKLRVLYECWPLAFIVEAAGGQSLQDGTESALDIVLASHDQRSPVCLGSRKQVRDTAAAMVDYSAVGRLGNEATVTA
ncbi:hypothetical protein N2152v2_003788 [Parachlorella kessleri]